MVEEEEALRNTKKLLLQMKCDIIKFRFRNKKYISNSSKGRYVNLQN